MRRTSTNPILAGIAALLLLQGCGGGGGGSDLSGTNVLPAANAGAAQTVTSGATVTLNGSASDSDGYITAYAWTQTAGPAVTLGNPAVAQTSFVAPLETVATTFTFALVATDNRGGLSPAATVTITVSPSTSAVVVTGTVRFARAPFVDAYPYGLNYAAPVMQPARGLLIRALNGTSLAEISTATTSGTGTYSLNVPANTNIVIQVVARLQQGNTVSSPSWNVDVQNGAAGLPYSYSSAAFNTSTAVQNIDIPLGIESTGVASATYARASGPFAILDTLYTVIQSVLTVNPTVKLPALYVDWGSQTAGTFFSPTTSPHLALTADLTEDTDEFDTHVIAHEFGHYIEYSFSRSDNIGGDHGLGDKLDPRVSWGEGWATAFGAIALNDPVYRDSFVDNGVSEGFVFSTEHNPVTSGTPDYDGTGCWCNEASVYSMLWDLYDGTNDGGDTISLGFAPIWAALTGAEATTPAFTTIFSFIDSLKQQRPGDAAAINALLATQNIDGANLDAFGSNETHSPLPNTLPLYTSITRGGGAVTLHTTDDAGRDNKLGDHRFLRFDSAAAGTITVTATTSNTNDGDPDFIVQNREQYVPVENPPNSQHSDSVSGLAVTTATTYVIDAYDCANGCTSAEGTPGDYDLTVTIN
ncbi:MAG: hypothetical protein WDO12_11070 [Pseudomonadota bacterium]